jgi:hypothetical protein
MARQVDEWATVAPVNPGMTLAIPTAALATIFRSYDKKAGTINLTELLSVLKQRMSGTEFYAATSPPLVQSATQSQKQAQIQQIIESIKRGQLK